MPYSKTFRQTIKALNDLEGKSETVLKRLVSDARSRVPGWVATEVTKTYNIKKGEITPSSSKKGKSGPRSAGSVNVVGKTIDGLMIVYKGRPLSPARFGMTPKVPRQSYTLKAEIIKGQKKVLGKKKKLTKKQRAALAKNLKHEGTRNSPRSPIMLMSTGAKTEDKMQYIPFQRVSENREDIEAKKTVSLPQMVSSERTREDIDNALSGNLEKRMSQLMKAFYK